MFKLDHHQKILTVLNSLDTVFFNEIGAYFGGGTLLALAYDEYRWSEDIDFICPVGEGYRELRSAVGGSGYDALFTDKSELEFPRDIKADQYGVRFAVIVEGVPIKFEIIAEGRISLDVPASYDWCRVPCLNFDDSCSEKLLSNADRWPDAGIKSRDLIDLAVLRLHSGISQAAYDKAEAAYPVIKPLTKAIELFQSDAAYRDRCFTALKITDSAMVNEGVALLAKDHGVAEYIEE